MRNKTVYYKYKIWLYYFDYVFCFIHYIKKISNNFDNDNKSIKAQVNFYIYIGF